MRRRVPQRRCDPSLILPSSRYLIRDGRDVSNYAPTVGKDPSLRCFPADWRCVLQIIQWVRARSYQPNPIQSLYSRWCCLARIPPKAHSCKQVDSYQARFPQCLYPSQDADQAFIFIEELPVRLAHRVKELDELPHHLSEMPSIIKVKEWYATSFQVTALQFLNSQLLLRIESSL